MKIKKQKRNGQRDLLLSKIYEVVGTDIYNVASYEYLAKELGISINEVQIAVNQLINYGLVRNWSKDENVSITYEGLEYVEYIKTPYSQQDSKIRLNNNIFYLRESFQENGRHLVYQKILNALIISVFGCFIYEILRMIFLSL